LIFPDFSSTYQLSQTLKFFPPDHFLICGNPEMVKMAILKQYPQENVANQNMLGKKRDPGVCHCFVHYTLGQPSQNG